MSIAYVLSIMSANATLPFAYLAYLKKGMQMRYANLYTI